MMARRLEVLAGMLAMLGLSSACGSPAAVGPQQVPNTGAAAASVVTAGTSGPSGTAGTAAFPNTPKAGGPAVVGPTAGTGGPAPTGTGTVPCAVSKILATNCQTCHSATPVGGAPMPLVTFADLQAAAKTQPSMKVYQLAQARIHDTARPMPPTNATQLAPADLATLDAWLKGGALTASGADAMCGTPTTKDPVKGEGSHDGSHGALVAGPGETCYEFKVHESVDMVDATPYSIDAGEHYEQFYYKVPWPKDTIGVSYATVSDNAKVLHHWLLFSTTEAEVDGFHKTAPLPTLIGTDPVLLAGWAVGGPNLVTPKDVGLELPDPGPDRQINVQWHFYNSTGTLQKDASSVQICTVPKAMRPHIGNISWLGTEDLGGNKWTGGAGMPPHKESTFTTTCTPGREGLGATDSIHIIGFEPHMHRVGKRMSTSVKHANGMMEMIFDKPFEFGSETHYYQEYELKPGEQLVTSCSFNNDTDMGIPFGESSDTEMCYQFTYAWPAHALKNGAASLLGVPDTCW